MKKKILFFTLAYFFLSVCPNAHGESIIVNTPKEKYYGDEQVRPKIEDVYKHEIEDIENYLNSFYTFVAHFKQSNTKGEISYGKIFINKPGKIRTEYFSPTPLLLIINDNKITYYDKELDEISYTKTDSNALNLLSLEGINLKKLNLVKAAKEKGFVAFTVLEYSTELKQDVLITLKFSYPKVELKQVNINNEENDVTMIFDKININQKLGKELFYFNRPRNIFNK